MPKIPDPREQPTMTVPEAAELLRIGRSAAYEQARRYLATDGAEGIPVIRLGRRLRVPTAALLRLLGLDDTGPPEAGKTLGPSAAPHEVNKDYL